jgi:hypothetical protein
VFFFDVNRFGYSGGGGAFNAELCANEAAARQRAGDHVTFSMKVAI